MKHLTQLFSLLFIIALMSHCNSDFEKPSFGAIDGSFLTKYDYFNEESSLIESKNTSLSKDDKKAALGRALFYEKKLSENDAVSCGSCHQQSLAFADNVQFSKGLFDEETTRNTSALVNCISFSEFFWDNRSKAMEDAVLQPIRNHIEMGIADINIVSEKLMATDVYPFLLQEAYPGDRVITERHISESLAQFVQSMISVNSKFDQGTKNDFFKFTQQELQGKKLFEGKALCSSCHTAPSFTRSWSPKDNIGLDLSYADNGEKSGVFKIPTLRNIALTSPYMHDGRFQTLEEVVEHYNSKIQDHPNLAWVLTGREKKPIKLGLSSAEKSALISFLKTLTDQEFIENPKFSNPFQ